MFDFYEWYSELPRLLKFGVALLMLAGSWALFLNGVFTVWGWALGFLLLMAAIFD